MMANQEGIRINWHGHSCFSLNNHRSVITLDPYKPEKIGYPELSIQAHAIFASHDHEDHNDRSNVALLETNGTILKQALPHEDWPEESCEDCWCYRVVESFHDDAKGAKRGRNKIHVFRSQGLTIAHLGDLGHPLSSDQVEAIGPTDLALIPVGGHYTIDAKQALTVAGQLKPRNIAPMHYQIGYGSLPIDTHEEFLKMAAHEWHLRDLRGPELTLKLSDSGYCFVFQFQPLEA